MGEDMAPTSNWTEYRLATKSENKNTKSER